MPQKSVSHLVARQALLAEMSDRFLNHTSSRTIVLLGMGGSGKTQLALEFCRQAEESLGFMAIIWIDASSPASVAQSYKIIAKSISKDRQDDVESDVTISLVHNALRGWKERWLVVFDNYDNPKAFQSQGIRHYIPSGNSGCILFTSRHADSTRLGHSIAVSGMNDSESLSLLLQRVPLNEEEKIHGREIASALGHLALALDQAGAYIRARNLKLKDFIPHYNKRKEVILREIPDEWEYRRVLQDAERETSLSVFTTWELSFEQISGDSEEKESKDHFLTLAAFFDNRNISERYFQAHFNLDRPEWMDMFSTERKWDSYKLGDVLAELRKLSLLQTPGQQTNELQFSLHPVVRDWVKLRKNRDIQQQFAVESITALTNYLQNIDNDEISLEIQQETALHIDACVQNGKEFLEGLPYFNLSYLPSKASWFAGFYCHQGRYDEAEELCRRALAGREEKLGPTHPSTLRTVQNLATVLTGKGQYGEAEELYRRALADREEKLGPTHPSTLGTVQNLATVLTGKGQYDEAEELYKRALAGSEEKLGPTHPSTLRTVQNLAIVHADKGRYDEAEELYKRALAGREEKLGPTHPDTLRTVQNLATVLEDKGQYDEAEELYKRALAGREEKLGPTHPSTLRTVQNLANVLADKGQYDEAEELYKRALAGREEKLGPTHPDTLGTVENLANFLTREGRYDEAEELYKRALADREEKLGPTHPSTLRTVQNLVMCLEKQGRSREAKSLRDRFS